MRHVSLCLLFAFVLTSTFAAADVIWSGGIPNGEQDVSLVPGELGIFLGSDSHGITYGITGITSGGLPVSITTTFDGSTSSGTDQLYSSTASDLLANPIGSADTSIDQLTISVPGHTFGDIGFNAFGMLSGTESLLVSVLTNDGIFTHTYDGLGRGANPIFITTGNGETIQSVALSDTRFYALKDLVISSPVAVPEPASLLLLGTGLTGLAGFLRRRISK